MYINPVFCHAHLHDYILVPSLYYYYYYYYYHYHHHHHQYGRPSLADIVPKTQQIPHFVKHSSAGYAVIQYIPWPARRANVEML